MTEDTRPASVFDDVREVELVGVKAAGTKNTPATVVLSGVSAFTVERSRVPGGAGAFIQLNGRKSTGIRILNNDLQNVGSILTPSRKVPGIILSGNVGPRR